MGFGFGHIISIQEVRLKMIPQWDFEPRELHQSRCTNQMKTLVISTFCSLTVYQQYIVQLKM